MERGSRKGFFPACHFLSWGSSRGHSEMSSWEMTIFLSQASTIQLKTNASITLPFLFIHNEMNICLHAVFCQSKWEAHIVKNEFLETNGKLKPKKDSIFRSLCSQPVKTVSWPSSRTVMVSVSLLLIQQPCYPHSQQRDMQLMQNERDMHLTMCVSWNTYIYFMFPFLLALNLYITCTMVAWMVDDFSFLSL